jgi:hypothetical protein
MHVVLAIEMQFLQNTLGDEFLRQHDVHVLDRADDEIDIAVFLRTLLGDEPFDADEPVALIITIGEGAKIPAVCSRLLEEFPELVVLAIARYSGPIRSYRMEIKVQEHPPTMEGLNSALRAIAQR